MRIKLLCTLLLAGFGIYVHGEEAKRWCITSPDEWIGQTAGLETGDGKFVVRDKTLVLISRDAYPVKPGKRYRLSGDFRKNRYATFANVDLGVIPYDVRGRQIMGHNILHLPGTQSVLTAAAAKGDRQIRVADASGWKSGNLTAFHVREDLGDLPNFALSGNIGAIRQADGSWLVELDAPLESDYPAGCAVRQHSRGTNNIYFVRGPLPEFPPNKNQLSFDWLNFSGIASGVSGYGNTDSSWWRGTASVRILLHNRDNRTWDISFRNICLEGIDE